jgi:CheY-like chemotaxis protein
MGADNFMVMLWPGDVERYCREVILRFERIRSDLFRQSDRQRGYIVTADRTGRMRRFSLMGISIGAITSELRSFRGVQEALDAARWALHQAKVRARGNCYLRRDGPQGLVEARKTEASKKILVVDGDALSRRLLKSRLEREGYKVRTATSGREALEIARAEPPDLIFLDDELSKASDCQTPSCLKKDARTAAIPLVMLTASTDREGERSVEVDDYLIKPYSFKYLVRKVEEHLDHS